VHAQSPAPAASVLCSRWQQGLARKRLVRKVAEGTLEQAVGTRVLAPHAGEMETLIGCMRCGDRSWGCHIEAESGALARGTSEMEAEM
jgi:hypothetical protein